MRDNHANSCLPYPGFCCHCHFDVGFLDFQVDTAAQVLARRSKLICKDYIRRISSQFGNLCYSMHTMSEINRGMPEGVTQKTTIIDLDVAKGKRLESEAGHAKWQERIQKYSLAGVEASRTAITSISPEIPTEANKPSPSGRRVEFSASAGKTGKIRPLAESTHTIIELQTARENRSVDKKVVSNSVNRRKYAEDEEKRENENESDQLTREKQQIKAMGIIGAKLAEFDVPMQKQDEIFENLADDPKAILKVAGVVRNFHPQNSIEILENIAAFRKRIDQAVENKAAQGNEGTVRELSGFELLVLILGSLLKGSANAVAGDELEQIGLKEKEEKSA
jgi:hypothetical protein